MSESSEKLIIKKKTEQGICALVLSGSIDEDFDYKKLLTETYDKYLVDFNEVTLINSCGIREWITFIEKLGSDKKIIYINCPQIIVQQINMVEGFINEHTYVHSFYAPYYSEELDLEKSVLLKSEDIKDFKAPEVIHEGKEMEFDAHEKQYFHFLSLQRKVGMDH